MQPFYQCERNYGIQQLAGDCTRQHQYRPIVVVMRYLFSWSITFYPALLLLAGKRHLKYGRMNDFSYNFYICFTSDINPPCTAQPFDYIR
jgi:hypothetical protein